MKPERLQSKSSKDVKPYRIHHEDNTFSRQQETATMLLCCMTATQCLQSMRCAQLLHSRAKCNFPFSWGLRPPDPPISRPGGLRTGYSPKFSKIRPLKKMLTLLDCRPENQIFVMTISTISMHQSRSISIFYSLGGGTKGDIL